MSGSSTDAASSPPRPKKNVAKSGLFLTAAKVYFILIGLAQQIALKHVLGLGGYGAYSTASSVNSITYNPLNQTSILGVSRETAHGSSDERAAIFRQLLKFHGLISGVVALAFAALATPIASRLGAPHVATPLLVLSAVILGYGFYTPMIGYLNGQHRFGAQAALDVTAATLRTIGLIAGAYWGGVVGATLGFAVTAIVMVVITSQVSGTGFSSKSQFSLSIYLKFFGPLLAGQVLLNLLFQADSLLLRRFAATAAQSAGLLPTAADPYVGAYRAAQLFCFLPYQLLMSITFILFPLLAGSWKKNDLEKAKEYISTGTRLAVLIAGLLVTGLVSNPEKLITLVYGGDAAHLAQQAMSILAVGLGFFSVLGVITSALNSIGGEKDALLVIGSSTIMVALFCFFGVSRTDLSVELLSTTAMATSSALVAGTLLSIGLLYRRAGRTLSLITLLKVILAASCAILISQQFAKLGLNFYLDIAARAFVGTVVYFFFLGLVRELNREDLQALRSLFRS
ncbi:MAG: oligosaccharide flippase family protein [Polyangiaceae bacterium]|nr:oligosaccharide flippase family protein [Polyangiaceae bacterium]